MSGWRSAITALIWRIHSFWFAAVSEALIIANAPFPPRSRAACPTSVSAIPLGVA